MVTLSFYPWQIPAVAVANEAAESEHGQRRADELFAAANAGLHPGALAEIVQDDEFMIGAPMERAFFDRLQEHLGALAS